MNKNEPLFIYFIPMINEDNREVIFSTTINEFEINNNNSDTAVIIMPESFYVKNEDQGEVNEDSNHIVKMMFYNLIENFKSLLLFDKIIIFHNNMLLILLFSFLLSVNLFCRILQYYKPL